MTNLITRKGSKLQLTDNLVTGDTYPVKDFLKTYCAGKWDKERKGWIVDTDKLSATISRSNHIGLRVDDNPTPSRKMTGSTSSNGWCNLCHSYCWGDCEANS